MVLTTITIELTPLYFYWNNIDHNLSLFSLSNSCIAFASYCFALNLGLQKERYRSQSTTLNDLAFFKFWFHPELSFKFCLLIYALFWFANIYD